MALSTSYKWVSTATLTRSDPLRITRENVSENTVNVEVGSQEGDHDREGQGPEIITAPARGRKRARSMSDDNGDDGQPARKRTRNSPSVSPLSSRSNSPAIASPHTHFHDTTIISIEPNSGLCSSLPTTDTDCAICLYPLASASDPPQSLARHAQFAPLYHTACLERWAEEGRPTCPNCRGELLPRRKTAPVVFQEVPDGVSEQVLSELIVNGLLEAGDLGFSDEEESGVRALDGLVIWG